MCKGKTVWFVWEQVFLYLGIWNSGSDPMFGWLYTISPNTTFLENGLRDGSQGVPHVSCYWATAERPSVGPFLLISSRLASNSWAWAIFLPSAFLKYPALLFHFFIIKALCWVMIFTWLVFSLSVDYNWVYFLFCLPARKSILDLKDLFPFLDTRINKLFRAFINDFHVLNMSVGFLVAFVFSNLLCAKVVSWANARV